MKKLFISMMAAVMSLSAVADVTTTANIKLVGSNTTYANYTLRLKEDANRTNAYESGYDVESMMSLSNPYSVLIYGLVGDKNCEEVAAQNLDGLQIGFTTNMVDASYTLQFSNVTGRTLKLYDLVEDVETLIENAGSYVFSVESSQVGQVAVTDRFVINYVAPSPYSVTTNAYGFCSFASSEDVEFLGGLKAYKGLYEAGTNELTLVEVGTKVPANTGVILWNSNEAAETFYYNVGVDAGAADVTGNDFVGVVAATDPAGISADIYCLHGNELQKYVGTDDIPAGKAYLPIASGSAAPHRIVMRFNDAQGIEDIAAEGKAVKFVENGQIFIRRGNEVFNIQGQKQR